MALDWVQRARRGLPAGHPLTDSAWRLRHRVILYVLMGHAMGVLAFALAQGRPLPQILLSAAPLGILTWLAGLRRLNRSVRACLATFGLLTASVVLVHLSGGLIELHFHFFVMLFVIVFYQDWATFLLAVGFVVAEHAVVGVLMPHAVYNHAAAWHSPVKWAGVHAIFVLGASVAAVLNWRLMEKAQVGERAMAGQLAHQANHDYLTGVLNRREFERRVTEALNRSRTRQQNHVLMMIDLDRFKIVNDTSGHLAGDSLLRQISMVLRAEIRSGDSLARLGGDEFGILLENCSLENATERAEALCAAVAQFRFVWGQRTFNIGASIGVAAITSLTASLDEAVQAVDAACYAAKDNGRNRIHVYRPDDDELGRRRGDSHTAGRVLAAIRENRLELYYQTIAPLNAASAVGSFVELLLRMRDEDGTLVSPGLFLPAAERYDLMPTVDRWVVDTAFEALASRYPAGRPVGGDLYSINLSGASIGDDTFHGFVRNRFEKYGIAPEVICFELTETVAITNVAAAVEFITELRALGCRFALDDFGAGLSSFSYLKNLPVDFLKIDGTFVKGITHDVLDRAMVESVNRIAHEVGLRTVAEFVETAAIQTCLEELGVDFAQGYAISRPAPFAELLQASQPFMGAA